MAGASGVDDAAALDRWLDGFRPGWHAREDVDRFFVFVGKRLDDVEPVEIARFEETLIRDGVGLAVRRRILDRVTSLLWRSRWQPVVLVCPLCRANGLIEWAQVLATGRRIYTCIESGQCWDTPEAVQTNASYGIWDDRHAALKWWHLAPANER